MLFLCPETLIGLNDVDLIKYKPKNRIGYLHSFAIEFLIYRVIQMIVGVQLSSGNSAPNSGNNHHLTIPFEGGMHSFVCIPELKVRIRTAIETITADMLHTVWNELDYRV